MPMRSVAFTCEKLGLNGISYETAVRATDKGKMIRSFEEDGVEHPWYVMIPDLQELHSVREKVSYPCISKPVDNAGSRGVMLIREESELENAITYSSRNGRSGSVIVEEYLQGKEVSVEIMVIDGEVHVLQVTDKLTTGAPHFVEMGHSQPSRLGEEKVAAIRDLCGACGKIDRDSSWPGSCGNYDDGRRTENDRAGRHVWEVTVSQHISYLCLRESIW